MSFFIGYTVPGGGWYDFDIEGDWLMEGFFRTLTDLNSLLSGLVWGPAMVGFMLLVGIYFTVGTGFVYNCHQRDAPFGNRCDPFDPAEYDQSTERSGIGQLSHRQLGLQCERAGAPGDVGDL